MKITIQDLEKVLLVKPENKISIEIEGMIATIIEIENANIQITEDELIIYNKKAKNKQVKFNTHQIMKIEKVDQNNFFIKFDDLQQAKLKKLL